MHRQTESRYLLAGAAESPASSALASPSSAAWNEALFYEMHVKGFTKLNERVLEEERGTFAGLAHVEALRKLADEFMVGLEKRTSINFGTSFQKSVPKGVLLRLLRAENDS